MKKIRVAVVGYGNVGRYTVQAVQAAPDMELVGIVRRSGGAAAGGIPVLRNAAELDGADVAVLCVPSRRVEETAEPYLSRGICTVDSFDIHSEIAGLRRRLAESAKKNGAAAVLSAGWDPGSDSLVRALLEASAPRGTTYTNFGPGMSMGHTVAAKAIAGVADALSITLPAGAGVHRRQVYIQLEPQADFADVAAAIKADPYFSSDDTQVQQVADVAAYMDVGHGVEIVRKGVSGQTHNQMFSYEMRVNNPAMTSQIMVSAARAATRQAPGAYTLIEVPVVDLLPGEREDWIHKLV